MQDGSIIESEVFQSIDFTSTTKKLYIQTDDVTKSRINEFKVTALYEDHPLIRVSTEFVVIVRLCIPSAVDIPIIGKKNIILRDSKEFGELLVDPFEAHDVNFCPHSWRYEILVFDTLKAYVPLIDSVLKEYVQFDPEERKLLFLPGSRPG